jgi:hypothetical protein
MSLCGRCRAHRLSCSSFPRTGYSRSTTRTARQTAATTQNRRETAIQLLTKVSQRPRLGYSLPHAMAHQDGIASPARRSPLATLVQSNPATSHWQACDTGLGIWLFPRDGTRLDARWDAVRPDFPWVRSNNTVARFWKSPCAHLDILRRTHGLQDTFEATPAYSCRSG